MLLLTLGCLVMVNLSQVVVACPFCNPLVPTLAQQKDRARVIVLGERRDRPSGDPQTSKAERIAISIRGKFKGKVLVAERVEFVVSRDCLPPASGLALYFGETDSDLDAPATQAEEFDRLRWISVSVEEASLVYFVGAPDLQSVSASERLAYFAPRLEDADPTIAEDAYLEFAHAKLPDVAVAARRFSAERLRTWVESAAVPDARKGLYGLMLGLADVEPARTINRKLLERLVANEARDDFRTGFDGILGGYLLLGGDSAIAEVERRFLIPADASPLDVRHALAALRFLAENNRDAKTRGRICQAVRHALKKPPFAENVIIDLARWGDSEGKSEIAGFFKAPAYDNPGIRRAIVGYLSRTASSEDKTLETLEAKYPEEVGEARAELKLLGR